MSVPDVTAAVADYLLGHVGDLVEGRVFRPELPQSQDASMPQAAIVVRRAGGYARYGSGTGKVVDPRIDAVCFGAVRLEADTIAAAVAEALMQLTPHDRQGVQLKTVRVSGGPLPLVDPQTQWPYTLVVAQVVHGRAAV